MHVEMLLPEAKVKYLEQMITFVDQETTEVQDPMHFGLHSPDHRQELTSQSYVLRHRSHVFDAVDTATITYCARAWTTTKEHSKCSALPRAECFVPLRQREKTKRKTKTA